METGVKPPFAHQVQMGGRQQGKTATQLLEEALRSVREPEFAPIDESYMLRQQAESRLHRHRERYPEISKVWVDEAGHLTQHQIDALKYAMHNPPPVVAVKNLADYADAEMVMEMIRRGYAVMKLPADGGPPESLR